MLPWATDLAVDKNNFFYVNVNPARELIGTVVGMWFLLQVLIVIPMLILTFNVTANTQWIIFFIFESVFAVISIVFAIRTHPKMIKIFNKIKTIPGIALFKYTGREFEFGLESEYIRVPVTQKTWWLRKYV